MTATYGLAACATHAHDTRTLEDLLGGAVEVLSDRPRERDRLVCDIESCDREAERRLRVTVTR